MRNSSALLLRCVVPKAALKFKFALEPFRFSGRLKLPLSSLICTSSGVSNPSIFSASPALTVSSESYRKLIIAQLNRFIRGHR